MRSTARATASARVLGRTPSDDRTSATTAGSSPLPSRFWLENRETDCSQSLWIGTNPSPPCILQCTVLWLSPRFAKAEVRTASLAAPPASEASVDADREAAMLNFWILSNFLQTCPHSTSTQAGDTQRWRRHTDRPPLDSVVFG
eukprot:850599-Amorphochlora_amoeboformis.AAC.2